MWSPGEGEGQQGVRGGRGGAAQHRAGPDRPSLCHQAVCVPRSWCTPATSSSQTRRWVPALSGADLAWRADPHRVSVFQKSSICYLSFPDSHSGRPPRHLSLPCPALPWASLWDRPGPLRLAPRPRFPLWGDVLSPVRPPGSLAPVERGVWAEGPAGSGLCPSGEATSS